MTEEITIVLPQVSEDRISVDLRELTEEINRIDPELVAHGFLGGENGYGAEYENNVFEMHPYWWGECECGHENREWDWSDNNDHSSKCYQSVIRDRGFIDFGHDDYEKMPYKKREQINNRVIQDVCNEMGLDAHYGSYVHCTCDYQDNWQQWMKDNPHPAQCPSVRANFRHKATGVEIRWYKYIGRGMETPNLAKKTWRAIFTECLDSLEQNR